MERKISIKTIAAELGVSTALVSYVLNNKEQKARVGKEMAEMIRKKAAELNYTPNLIARSLKSGQTKTLGLIVADISNPFFSSIARIIEDEAKSFGYTVVFGSSDESAQKSQNLIKALVERQVDGFIIAPAEHSEEQIEQLKTSGIPFVLIDRFFPGISTNVVCVNNYQVAYEAVDHLIKNGNKRIAMLAYDTSLYHMRERIRGYKEALQHNKMEASDKWLLRASYDKIENDVAHQMRTLLASKPRIDAILFATNSLAIPGLSEIVKAGIRIPEELAIVSFDSSDAFDFFYAPLTYVNQSVKDIGKEAVRLLLSSMKERAKKPLQITVGAQLIVRASSKR